MKNGINSFKKTPMYELNALIIMIQDMDILSDSAAIKQEKMLLLAKNARKNYELLQGEAARSEKSLIDEIHRRF